MVRFIDDHKEEYGAEPICSVLPVAPSTYYAHKAREADPTLRSARAERDEDLRDEDLRDEDLRDEDLRVEIQRVWEANFEVYGVRKVWRQLRRAGIAVARCTVARRRIVGWRVSNSLKSDLALDALEQAICEREETQRDRLIHHSGTG